MKREHKIEIKEKGIIQPAESFQISMIGEGEMPVSNGDVIE
jgi:hypothetical protein